MLYIPIRYATVYNTESCYNIISYRIAAITEFSDLRKTNITCILATVVYILLSPDEILPTAPNFKGLSRLQRSKSRSVNSTPLAFHYWHGITRPLRQCGFLRISPSCYTNKTHVFDIII